ncbi:Retrovirus-related Pol polyprotein from transposon 412 [Frankliniella fusca]|uniref:RNA-directed DNA polymerase n=1 Tax=Frankliniella fusca TaxID=407009 RepID=A0AAE1L765_9NEOP|nr:Retrovirus-related Pol polyprotein from transposon 412 [Frankliniella fusca]
MEVESEKTDKISSSLNVKPPVMSPDKELSKEKECSFQSENHREVLEVPCLVCTTVNTAPMIDCKILNVNKSGCIDTAAVITVIPRTRDLPVAKLKLKGVTSHKANLYGPAMTEFEIGGKVFKHNTYEADIHENILGIDFLHKFDAVIGIKKQVLEIGEGLDRVQVPFTLGETKTARIYTTDRVAYTIRAEGSFKLRPFVEREIQTKLETDAVTDEPMGEGIGAFESSGDTQGLDLGGQGHTQSRVVLETQVADQAVLSGSKGTSKKGSLNKRGQLPGETKLGLFISNPAFGNKVSRLPLGVIAQSGVIPCLTAPISITMQNLGDKCVTIPKYAVLGEVFILHPDKYEQEFNTNFQEEEEVDEGIDEGMDTDETVQVNVINHDTTPFSDAEINTIPNLPAIGENEPLPKDLQDLVERKITRMTKDTIDVNWTRVIPDGLSPKDIRKAQLLDADIMPIMVAVQDQKKPEFQEIAQNGHKTRSLWYQFNSLVIEGGILYRKFEHPSGIKEKEELQLILPAKLVKPTVKAYHEQLGVGNHFGVSKTLAYIKRFFWWPGMFEDTYEVISQCGICAKFKGPTHQTKVPLKLFQEGVLHGRWHVDICGPINPKSKEGFEYILVAVEAFSGWPVVVPLYKQTADEVAQALITHFSPYEVMFGAAMRSPLDLDRGSPPQNEEMHKMYPFWVRKTMQDIHEAVAHMSKKAAKRMKAYYDRNATLSPFLEGDLVYLYYPRRVKGISAKLITRWEGPYRIVNLINDCNARIERVDNPSKKLIVHIDRLARCPAPDTAVNKQDDMRNAWLLFIE